MTRRLALPMALATAWLAGCAAQLGPPMPSAENLRRAASATMAPARLGTFALAPGRPPEMDKRIVLRTTIVASPVSDSMAGYLRGTLEAELRAAGLLDEASPVQIEGQLTDSGADAATGTGSARLAARFIVTRAGQQRYNRELQVQHRWPSSFIGVEAIPEAANQYTLLQRKLVGALLDDPDFQRAMAR